MLLRAPCLCTASTRTAAYSQRLVSLATAPFYPFGVSTKKRRIYVEILRCCSVRLTYVQLVHAWRRTHNALSLLQLRRFTRLEYRQKKRRIYVEILRCCSVRLAYVQLVHAWWRTHNALSLLQPRCLLLLGVRMNITNKFNVKDKL